MFGGLAQNNDAGVFLASLFLLKLVFQFFAFSLAIKEMMEQSSEKPKKQKEKSKEQTTAEQSVVKRSIPVDMLDVPNHMAPIYNGQSLPFPELYLMRSDGSSTPTGLLFVDPSHKMVDWWSRDSKAPPTWMDPCVFTKMAFADQDIVATMRKAAKANSRDKAASLDKQLEDLFIKQYLVYALKEFRKVKQSYKQWLLAKYAVNQPGENVDVSDQSGGVRNASDEARRNGGSGSRKVERGRVRRLARSESS